MSQQSEMQTKQQEMSYRITECILSKAESQWKTLMWRITQSDLLFNKITLATLECRYLVGKGGRSCVTNPGGKYMVVVVVMRGGHILDTF